MDDSVRWAEAEFGRVRLGRKTRNRRALKFAAALAFNPGVSFPKMLGDWSEMKATYEFLAGQEVRHRDLIASHIEATVERCRGRRCVLVIQDKTFLSFGGAKRKDRADLGPIDTKTKTAGLVVHTALAVDADTDEVLGVLGQHVWARRHDPYGPEESKAARHQRSRESDHWGELQQEVETALSVLGRQKPFVVGVFDREGDEYRAFSTMVGLEQGFVIRVNNNRSIETDELFPETVLDRLLEARSFGKRVVEVKRKDGRLRKAELTLRATTVELRPPSDLRRKGDSFETHVVLAQEEEPPEGEESVRWILYTTLPVQTHADISRVMDIYERRWIVEEFHMGLKTGCSIEARQLQTGHALRNFLAFASAVAARLLHLRDEARKPTSTANSVLGPVLLSILIALRPKDVTTESNARDALRAVAKLGGFIGRKSDGEPGWRTLWGGYRRLLDAEEVWKLARETR